MKRIAEVRMAGTISILTKYLEELGATTGPPTPDPDRAQLLPVFLTRVYDTYRARLFDEDYILLILQSRQRPTPGEVAKQAHVARETLGRNVAFVLPDLHPFERKRLIERRIPFIVPGRQTYLPMKQIDLREYAKGGRGTPVDSAEIVSAPAQLLLLFQLQRKQEAAAWPLNKWGEVLGYSRSTLTRVTKELASSGLCQPIERGREVVLCFPEERRQLWDKAEPRLRSPVAGRTLAMAPARDELQLFRAGITALADLTMVSPDHEEIFAMSSSAFRAAAEDHKIIPTHYPEEGAVTVERWNYPPGALSTDRRTVDRLSLYLSLRDDQDERIQSALKEVLEEVPW
jgi:DNA-binding MarR family transcriptional regulator